ncbi:MAG: ABC transporter permease [Bacteroidales bacterium]|jgi:putative ABC transport system permease protein|nr:ABC transporter permease [Bacteroidales bacterium]
MNISALLAFRSLKKNKVRTLTTSLGIVLSIVLITTIIILVFSLMSSLIATTEATYGSWHVSVMNATDDQIDTIKENVKINRMAFLNDDGYSTIETTVNEKKPYIQINSATSSFFEMLPITLLDGSFPTNNREIIIPAHLAMDYKEYGIGNKITLTIGKRYSNNEEQLTQNSGYLGIENEGIANFFETNDYLIVGICEQLAFLEHDMSPGYSIIRFSEQIISANKLTYFKLEAPKNGISQIEKYVSEENIVYNNDLLSVLGAKEGENIANTMLVLVIALVIIVELASFILIHNSFMIVSNEKVKQYGLLFSVGATRKQIIYTLLFEAIYYCLILVPIGILCGIGFVLLSLKSIGSLIAQTSYLNIIFTLNINIIPLLIIALISVFLIITSSLLPAIKSTRQPIISTIRENKEINIKFRKKNRENNYKGNIERELSIKNFFRHRKRFYYLIFSLMFSTVLFVSAGSYCSYANSWLKESMDVVEYDIECHASNENIYYSISEIYNPLSTLGGVDESGWFSTMYAGIIELNSNIFSEDAFVYLKERGINTVEMQYVFVSDDKFETLIKNTKRDKNDYLDKSNLKVLVTANLSTYRMSNDSVITENIDFFKYKNFASTLFYMNNDNRGNYYSSPDQNYKDNSRPILLNFDMIEKDDLIFELSSFKDADGIFSIIPISMLDSYTEEPPEFLQMFFKANDHKGVFALMEKFITEKNLDVYLADITSGYEVQENTIGLIDIFSKIFILIISIITLLNAFNTTLANLMIRRREFAIMKSVGMSNKSLINMLSFESCLVGGVSLGGGLVFSAIISYILKMSFSSGKLKFFLPLNHILIAVAGIILILLTTLIYAAIKMSSDNIIESIRSETN